MLLSVQNTSTIGTAAWYVPAIYIGIDGKLRVSCFWGGSTGNQTTVDIPDLRDNKWHNVVVTYAGTGAGAHKTYVDGILKGSITKNQSWSGAGVYFYVGGGKGSSNAGWSSTANGDFWFNGNFGDFKYYNRALSKENMNRYLLKGFNGNDFTFLQVAQSIAHLCNRLNIESHKMKLTNLEIGVNFIPPVDTIQILDGLILHQGKEFSKPESYQYRQVVHSQFYIKVYNKAKQYNLLNQLCRYELKFVKMASLNSIGITTLADLTEKAVYKRFESIFLAAWSKTLFFDYTINKDDLREKQISQIKDYSNPIYWLRLSSKHRDRPKKELQKITESYSDNIQAKALKVIKLKWNELLSV